MHSCIHSSTRPSIHPSIHPFIHSFYPLCTGCFLPGSPLPKLIVLKSRICIFYMHTSLRTQEINLGSIFVLWCINARQQKSFDTLFMGGRSIQTCNYRCQKPGKNVTWLFEAFWSFFFSPQYLIISDHKVGNKDFIFWYWKWGLSEMRYPHTCL